MRDVVIVQALRTAVGAFGGTLKPLNADGLAAEVIKVAISRSQTEPEAIDAIIMGHCRQSSDRSNTARFAALRAGVPESVPACTVMCACASGMLAVNNGCNAIRAEQDDIVLAGGVESMTNADFYLPNARWGVGTGTTELKDSLTEGQFNSQPQDIYGKFSMGITAENVAKRMGIPRRDQDEFAFASQRKAAAAISAGKFRDEIIPVTVSQGGKVASVVFDTDEYPRQTSPEKLAALRPAFDPENGTVTAGNSSGRNDGASILVLMSKEKAEVLGLRPLAVIRGIASTGVDPRMMGLGPIPATKKVLEKTGLSLGDMELIELNEAFAAQSVACIREMGLQDRMDIVNVNGGAIALGHPIGSSGARIIVTLVHEMSKRQVRYGLATLCVAGGMGMATVVERI
jgi:acetyl-CoA C-acetyltransferase